MSVNDEILNKIREYSHYNFTPRKICILLDLDPESEKQLMEEFSDPDSKVSRIHELGKAEKEVEIMQRLEKFVTSGAEGSGEAARALAIMRYHQSVDELRKKLFGV